MPTVPELVEAAPIIASLVIIEGLLSVDNALAIAAMASHLPERQKYLALRWGILGAYVFRGLALAFAATIIAHPGLKLLGAAYLVHLMAGFFARRAKTDSDETASGMTGRGFWATVAAIELMDLSLSVDNVVAAVAMSPKLWVVCTGVFIGILALRFVAGMCIRLIQRFPVLESTAFLLVGYVGAILAVELTAHIHIEPLQKFGGIAVILALSIWYSESGALRRILTPVLSVLRAPLFLYAAISNRIFGLLFLPLKAAARLFRKDSRDH
jgi:YkoY family integral membrane protein